MIKKTEEIKNIKNDLDYIRSLLTYEGDTILEARGHKHIKVIVSFTLNDKGLFEGK